MLGLYSKVLKELGLWIQCCLQQATGSQAPRTCLWLQCACTNPVGFKLTFASCQDNPWVMFNHSCGPNTCGMHHGSHPGVATVRVGNEELFP